MKRLMLIVVAALAVAGCSAVAKEDASIKNRNEAEEAAVKKIVVVEGDKIPNHPKYTELGHVQGVCVRAPWYDDDTSIARIGFKHAAYDQYGDKVDAIIRVDSFFVTDNQSYGIQEPGTASGHLNCQGTAVHFEPG
jgi:Ni/Co efflux regulator RcnB